jgi:hypothetical protein
MNTKHTVILFILAIVLVVSAFLFTRKEEEVVQQAAAPTKTVFSDLTSSTVTSIEIQPPSGKPAVKLTRRENTWWTDPDKKHKADKNQVSALFAAIEKEVTGEVVSTNEKNFGEYEVTDTSGTRVKIFGEDGKKLQDLYVGKAGPTFFTTFVRPADGNEVINANASLSYIFNKPDGWRDKTLFDLTVPSITGIEEEGTSSTFTVKKSGDKWTLEKPAGKKLKDNKIETLVSTLSTLHANDFVDENSSRTLAEMGLDPPRQKVTVTYEDRSTSPPKSKTAVLLIGNHQETPSAWYAKRTDSDSAVTIMDYQANTLAPSPSDVFEEPPAQEPTTATQSAASATSTTAVEKPTSGTATSAVAAPAPSTTTTAETSPSAGNSTISAIKINESNLQTSSTSEATTATVNP